MLVLGRLTAEGVVKCQFGASQVTRDRETKALLSLGDDLKAASTTLPQEVRHVPRGRAPPLRRAADSAGRAGEPDPDAERGWPPASAGRSAGRPPAAAAPPTTGGATPGRNASAIPAGAPAPPRRGRATPRQLDAIWKVARGKGLEPGAVEAMSVRVFNRKPDGTESVATAASIRTGRVPIVPRMRVQDWRGSSPFPSA